MPASNAFVEAMLDVIDKHFNSASLSDQAKLRFVKDIALIKPGNVSVQLTQARLLTTAKKRWKRERV